MALILQAQTGRLIWLSVRQAEVEAERTDLQHVAVVQLRGLARLAVDARAGAAGAVAQTEAAAPAVDDAVQAGNIRSVEHHVAAARTSHDEHLAVNRPRLLVRHAVNGYERCLPRGACLRFHGCFPENEQRPWRDKRPSARWRRCSTIAQERMRSVEMFT